MYKTGILWCVYSVFIVFGAIIFKELNVIHRNISIPKPKWIQVKGQLEKQGDNIRIKNSTRKWIKDNCKEFKSTFPEKGDLTTIIDDIESHCPDLHETDTVKEYQFTYIESFYFCVITTTTIGYGDIVPQTDIQRIFCIAYACLGVPLMGILMAGTASFFGGRMFLLFKSKLTLEQQRSKTFITLWTILYIFIGFVLFIFIPAIVFSAIEGWTYLTSVYYAFITLTTIGFGDYAAAKNTEPWNEIYQMLVILWILVGLGYWIMVVNFITRVLKSKRLHNSIIHRAEMIKKMVAGKEDTQFLTQRSKAAVNFIFQFSNMLLSLSEEDLLKEISSTGSHSGIPGVSSLFTGRGHHMSPCLNLFPPELLELIMKDLTEAASGLPDDQDLGYFSSNPSSPEGDQPPNIEWESYSEPKVETHKL